MTLESVIQWLENGCDPKEAVKELRIYQDRLHESERLARQRGLTLATLCDMVLGEECEDRSDERLIRAVGEKLRRLEFTQKMVEVLVLNS